MIMLSLWFVGLFIGFGILAKLMPADPSQPLWRKDMWVDVIYWFTTPTLYFLIKVVLITLGLSLILGTNDGQTLQYATTHGYGPATSLPIWLQALLVLLISDILSYWAHRWFHKGKQWDFHAIHHAPHELDWISSIRFHPVNFFGQILLVGVIVGLLGFSALTFALLAMFNTLYSSLVHANLNWTFGPLRYVLASPVFHRWHHTSTDEGGMKNFAPTFPFIDLLFGTFYMPADKRPEHFGVEGDPVPETFLGQMRYPFTQKSD